MRASAHSVRPRLGFADLLLQLWRAKGLMLLVFLPLFALGLLAAFMMPEKFTSQARLLVALGDEYVYRSAVGDDRQTFAPELEALVQSELELMRSPTISEAVIAKFDMRRVYPDLSEACEKHRAADVASGLSTEQSQHKCNMLAVEALRQDFGAGAAPKTPVITTTFTHENPDVAAEILNAITGEYLRYRSRIFSSSNSSGLSVQREQFEASLVGAEDSIRKFLMANGLGSFEGERQTIDELYRTASGELLVTESRLKTAAAQLDAYRKQIGSVPAEQDLYVEDASAQRLVELKLEREEKLTRYRADSTVIRGIDKQIEQTEAYLKAQDRPSGITRRGPHPLYADIEKSINTLQSESDALRAQQSELRSQIKGFEKRQQRLVELEPAYQELVRRRNLMAQNVEGFAEREIEARASSELVQQNVDNIRLLEPASIPIRGSSLKMPVAALAFLFAAFTALMAGLMKALSSRKFSTARSVERTLGVPVMASVKKY